MRVLYLDTFSGISGDMFLGLMVDLGVDPGAMENELRRLPVTGWSMEWGRTKRSGIEGTKVSIKIEETHHHRTWADIDSLLAESPLAPPVRELSRRIFRRIGEAEARVHGVPIEKVHFHEVGAVDSIIDIVGAAVGLELLKPDRILSSSLPLTRGMVGTAHGRFPLPAPATVEILRGCPVVDGNCDRELVTPTGAAITAEIAGFGPFPAMVPSRIGYGAGEMHLKDRPNLLRGILGEMEEPASTEADRVAVLESHIDDANPEWLGALMEDLLKEGALDAGFTPLQMKKNRPGVRVTVVAPPEQSLRLARLLLRGSSASGVRWYETRRFKLRRENRMVDTSLGPVEVKLLLEGETLLRVAPEYESCRRLARKCGLPLPEVYRAAERAADDLFAQKQEEDYRHPGEAT